MEFRKLPYVKKRITIVPASKISDINYGQQQILKTV